MAVFLIQAGNAARFQTGTITGEVREIDGGPAAGVRVAVTPESNPDVFARIGETDTSGHYRLDVAPGNYVVVAGGRAALILILPRLPSPRRRGIVAAEWKR